MQSISSAESWKLKTSKLSSLRPTFEVRGMAMTFWRISQRRVT